MIAKVPENISAQYEAQSRAIDAAHWAAQHHAGLTCEEWEAASKVSAADFNVALAVRGPLLWHQCRLAKQLGTSSLHSLRDTHADHPMVIAARKAAHKLAKVTDADRAASVSYTHLTLPTNREV